MSLHFPHAHPPAAGELTEVAPGVFWLRMPLPFQLDHINLWLLRDGFYIDRGRTSGVGGYYISGNFSRR